MLILLIGILTLFNFRIGYMAIFCSKIVIPHMVRLGIGSLSISISDAFSLFLLMSFILHRNQLIKDSIYPLLLKKYFILEIFFTLFLIVFSSGFVPYSYQFKSFMKFLLQDFLFMWMGYWAFLNVDVKKFLKILFVLMTVVGVYGIFSYYIKLNPYVDILYIVYSGVENLYSAFLDEERGGLIGRTSGTMTHPLGWGQMWNLIIGLYFLCYKSINKTLGLIIIIVGVINIVLCGSRAAIVALGIMYMFYLFSQNKTKAFKNLFLMSSLLLASLYIFRNNETVDKMSKYLQAAVCFWDQEVSNDAEIIGSGVDMRKNQLAVSIDKAATSPIGGLGYNYQLYVLDNDRKADDDLYGLESVVFKKLVEQGFVGFVIFIYTTILLFRYSRKKEMRENRLLITGYFCSYITTIIITGIQGGTWPLFFALLLLFKNRNIKTLDKCYDT